MEPLEDDTGESLVKEAERGRSDRTPAITLVAVTIAVSVLFGIVVGLVFLVQQFV